MQTHSCFVLEMYETVPPGLNLKIVGFGHVPCEWGGVML